MITGWASNHVTLAQQHEVTFVAVANSKIIAHQRDEPSPSTLPCLGHVGIVYRGLCGVFMSRSVAFYAMFSLGNLMYTTTTDRRHKRATSTIDKFWRDRPFWNKMFCLDPVDAIPCEIHAISSRPARRAAIASFLNAQARVL